MNMTATIESPQDATRRAESNTLLSPRFYRTNYKAMSRINVAPVRAEWDQMIAEFRRDINRDHFERDAAFSAQIRELPQPLQQEFLDFLLPHHRLAEKVLRQEEIGAGVAEFL